LTIYLHGYIVNVDPTVGSDSPSLGLQYREKGGAMWGVFEMTGYEYDLVASLVSLWRTSSEASIAASRRGDAYILPLPVGKGLNVYNRHVSETDVAEAEAEADTPIGVFTFSGYEACFEPELRFLGRSSEEAEDFLGGLNAAEKAFSFTLPLVMGARIEYPGPHDGDEDDWGDGADD
jgi:hypothetical protein